MSWYSDSVKRQASHCSSLGMFTCSFQAEEFTLPPAVNVEDEILGRMSQGQVPSRQSELITSCAEWQYMVMSCFLQAVWPSVPFRYVGKNVVCSLVMCCHTAQQLFRRFVVKDRQAQAACLWKGSNLMLKQPLFLWFFSIDSCLEGEESPIKWGGYT